MTNYGGREMAAAFRTVRGNTVKMAEEIPEAKYDVRAAPETRSIAQLLAHIAVATSFQLHVHTNKIDDLKQLNFPELFQKFSADEARPRTKAEIVAMLSSEGDAFASYLESLPQEFLSEQVAMPPGTEPSSKSRFEMLLSSKEHEMHHRAQLMIMQRMIGLVPHLTRQMQERLAQMQAGAQQAR